MLHKIPAKKLEAVCSRFDGDYGLYASVAETGETFAIHPDRIFYSASTIKVPILGLLLKDAEEGRVDLNSKRAISPDNRVGGSGILQSLSHDLELSLRDIAELMIVLSDNTATNEIIDAVGGLGRINLFCQEQGLGQTRIYNKMMQKRSFADSQNDVSRSNHISAQDLGKMMEQIIAEEFVSAQVSRGIYRIMAGQRLGRFSTGLPSSSHFDPATDPLPPPEGHVMVAGKGGTLTKLGISHDAAIFVLPDGRKYTLCVCTKTASVQGAQPLIVECARVMYGAMC